MNDAKVWYVSTRLNLIAYSLDVAHPTHLEIHGACLLLLSPPQEMVSNGSPLQLRALLNSLESALIQRRVRTILRDSLRCPGLNVANCLEAVRATVDCLKGSSWTLRGGSVSEIVLSCPL